MQKLGDFSRLCPGHVSPIRALWLEGHTDLGTLFPLGISAGAPRKAGVWWCRGGVRHGSQGALGIAGLRYPIQTCMPWARSAPPRRHRRLSTSPKMGHAQPKGVGKSFEYRHRIASALHWAAVPLTGRPKRPGWDAGFSRRNANVNHWAGIFAVAVNASETVQANVSYCNTSPVNDDHNDDH
jgi:hypothetical protein